MVNTKNIRDDDLFPLEEWRLGEKVFFDKSFGSINEKASLITGTKNVY